MRLFSSRAQGWDPQPTTPCQVLLAADGRRGFSQESVDEAVRRAAGGLIAVVTIARIHGTSFGLPNPGLLPTRKELEERYEWVGGAVSAVTARGGSADGQVVVTRRITHALAKVARARGADTIVIDETPHRGVRRFIEGDVGAELTRKLKAAGIGVVIVPAPRAPTEPHPARR